LSVTAYRLAVPLVVIVPSVIAMLLTLGPFDEPVSCDQEVN
jgi:hypothetical protein